MIPAKEIDGELWFGTADARIKDAAEVRLQMDLRDWFAAQAMQGLLAAGWWDSLRGGESKTVQQKGNELVAADAYQMADAMLKEREK